VSYNTHLRGLDFDENQADSIKRVLGNES